MYNIYTCVYIDIHIYIYILCIYVLCIYIYMCIYIYIYIFIYLDPYNMSSNTLLPCTFDTEGALQFRDGAGGRCEGRCYTAPGSHPNPKGSRST